MSQPGMVAYRQVSARGLGCQSLHTSGGLTVQDLADPRIEPLLVAPW